MYSLLTSAVLMFVLTPGVLIPGFAGVVWSALLHAVVFYIVVTYLSAYIPWWALWAVGGYCVYTGFTAPKT